MEFGPVQILVVGFTGDHFTGEILAELRRLREHDVIRLVDLAFVRKDDEGNLTKFEVTDLSTEEAAELGAITGALIGFGALGEEGIAVGAEFGAAAGADGFGAGETWAVFDTIPAGTAAAVALIEHRWAVPLREAIARAGGFALADTWVHPADLFAAGAALRADGTARPS